MTRTNPNPNHHTSQEPSAVSHDSICEAYCTVQYIDPISWGN